MKILAAACLACLLVSGCYTPGPGPGPDPAATPYPYPGRLHLDNGQDVQAPSWTNIPPHAVKSLEGLPI